jgi:hypothetical protein
MAFDVRITHGGLMSTIGSNQQITCPHLSALISSYYNCSSGGALLLTANGRAWLTRQVGDEIMADKV